MLLSFGGWLAQLSSALDVCLLILFYVYHLLLFCVSRIVFNFPVRTQTIWISMFAFMNVCFSFMLRYCLLFPCYVSSTFHLLHSQSWIFSFVIFSFFLLPVLLFLSKFLLLFSIEFVGIYGFFTFKNLASKNNLKFLNLPIQQPIKFACFRNLIDLLQTD